MLLLAFICGRLLKDCLVGLPRIASIPKARCFFTSLLVLKRLPSCLVESVDIWLVESILDSSSNIWSQQPPSILDSSEEEVVVEVDEAEKVD